MPIITFWSNGKEQTGKTMAIAAIATYMSIEHNYKILVISTTNREDNIKRCFWEEKKKKRNLGIFGATPGVEVESGVEGLARIIRSNKVSPETITNYTKVVFRDRLEILLGNEAEDNDFKNVYPEIINTANKYYDLVLVDLDYNIDEESRTLIMNQSDIVVSTLSQRLKSVSDYIERREDEPVLKSKKTLILVGRYDKFSKYNAKNITRYLGEKNQILTIPYNTLFFEAAEEAGVPDLFLRFRKSIDDEDRNALFISEIKRTVENIIYRLQDLQMKY